MICSKVYNYCIVIKDMCAVPADDAECIACADALFDKVW